MSNWKVVIETNSIVDLALIRKLLDEWEIFYTEDKGNIEKRYFLSFSENISKIYVKKEQHENVKKLLNEYGFTKHIYSDNKKLDYIRKIKIISEKNFKRLVIVFIISIVIRRLLFFLPLEERLGAIELIWIIPTFLLVLFIEIFILKKFLSLFKE